MMRTSLYLPIRYRVLLVALLLFGSRAHLVLAAVTVETTDGRVITGEVDAETDEQLLWVRQQDEQIMLTTSIEWSKIDAAHDGNSSLPTNGLRELLTKQATEEPFGFLVEQATYEQPRECADCVSKLPATTKRRERSPRVRSLEVDAYLVNLDRDVEPDGLEVVIAALDEYGLPVRVNGSLYARLWGERIQPHGSLVQYEDVQRWTQRVRKADFSEEGIASYRLRFRTVNPEFDLGLHADALINVRLGVTGQGNYEASVPVQIRKFNPVRDRLQLTRGERFFPNELTERTRRQLPHRTHTRQFRSR